MLNSSDAANRIARRNHGPGRDLHFDSRESGSAAFGRARTSRLDLVNVNSPPAVTPATVRADRDDGTFWWSVFTSLLEGFALYGAAYGSYGTYLHATATSPVKSPSPEASSPDPEIISPRERPRFIAIVYSNTEVTRPKLEDDTVGNRLGLVASENTDPAVFGSSLSLDRDRSNQRHWLTKRWIVFVSRWAHWHREREIKKAVARLAEFDDEALRNMGIPHRSQIESVVRYCHDC